MPIVRIEGYLVQKKLEEALKAIVGDTAWCGAEVPVENRRLSWDMVYEHNSQRVAVEFDGDEHYRHTLKIKVDLEKDAAARASGYRVVRMPYWIQLTSETLWHYFGLEAEIEQAFPHGFITTKVFPASFCALGLERFSREINEVPSKVRTAVIESLRAQAEKHGEEYVVPHSMRGLLRARSTP